MNKCRKQNTHLVDIAIAISMLTLAFLFKDASAEAKTLAMVTIATAILVRFKSQMSADCKKDSNGNCE